MQLMTQPEPLISVVTPAYNSASTLERAHRSVRTQRGKWEHIIVDDGSADDTPRILSSLSADPRVVTVTRTNGGTSAALNSGLDLARGEYIAFLDSDDEYCDDHFEAHLSVLETDGRIDLLWGGVVAVCNRPDDAYVPDVARGAGYIHVSECVLQGTIFARRRVFERLRFNEDRTIWYQDYEFVQRARTLFVVEQFTRPTYRYYRNYGSSTVDTVKQTWTGCRSAAAGR
jgi:glycosyltransferase involved in cell wall biosynthesis